MEELLRRFAANLLGRLHGPMQFRLVLQPATAALLALRAGILDARSGRPAYLWALATDDAHRRELVRNGWKDVGRVFFLAVVIDANYQAFVLHWFYPGEALATALVLGILPYILLRGPAARVAKLFLACRAHEKRKAPAPSREPGP